MRQPHHRFLFTTLSLLTQARHYSGRKIMNDLIRTEIILDNGTKLKRAHFKTLDSTQTLSKAVLADPSNRQLWNEVFDEHDIQEYSNDKLYLISADYQTNSYGRSNSVWHSLEGNFLGTYLFFWPDSLVRYLPYVSQAVGLSIAQTIESYDLPAEIKWTNDVLIGGKKAAGILCEALPVPNGMMILMGIGLNVNMGAEAARTKYQETQDPLKIAFTSMTIAIQHQLQNARDNNNPNENNNSITTQQSIDLEMLTVRLSLLLSSNLIKVSQGRFTSELHPEIHQRLAYRNQRVNYQDINESMENVLFTGITTDGFAVLQDERGESHVKLTGRIRPVIH